MPPKRAIVFADSWNDTTSNATRQYGDVGRRMALLLRASEAGSKRIQGSLIADAGFDMGSLLSWAEQPYSSIGLAAAARAMYDWLAEASETQLAAQF
jgi:hypothetical protein